jgi:hypothetical protein
LLIAAILAVLLYLEMTSDPTSFIEFESPATIHRKYTLLASLVQYEQWSYFFHTITASGNHAQKVPMTRASRIGNGHIAVFIYIFSKDINGFSV